MLSFRRRFGVGLYRVMGGTGSAVGAAAGPGVNADVRRANRFYFAVLVLLVIVTFGLLLLRGNTVGIQATLAAMWGLFLGGTLLFYLSKTLIITIFGTVLGASVAKIKSVVDGVQNFTQIAQQLTDLLNKAFDPPPHIYNGSACLFLLLVLLSCLPAYSEK
jgi:hypothetical protein